MTSDTREETTAKRWLAIQIRADDGIETYAEVRITG